MSPNTWTEPLMFFSLLFALTPLFGEMFYCVLSGKRVPFLNFLRPLELFIYRATRASKTGDGASGEMDWKEYLVCVALFSCFGVLLATILQLPQHAYPLSHAKSGPESLLIAIQTVVNFATNFAWQTHSGETAIGNFAQMMGIATLNFTIAATGIAAIAAFARRVSRRRSDRLGNFWGDIVRATLYILLPISVILAIVLVSGANSARLFDNPILYGNFVSRFSTLLILSALAYSFAALVIRPRRGVSSMATMFVIIAFFQGVYFWS